MGALSGQKYFVLFIGPVELQQLLCEMMCADKMVSATCKLIYMDSSVQTDL